MRIDRNLGINAFRVELLGGYVAFFKILANVNGIGGCIGIPEDVCRLIATVSSVTYLVAAVGLSKSRRSLSDVCVSRVYDYSFWKAL